MIYLIDSSSWIEFFRGNPEYAFIIDLINSNTICTNDIILAELLPSIYFRKEYKLANLLKSIRKYSLKINWGEICQIQILNLKNGNNHIGISDIVIYQNCIQNNLKLISHDKHFKAMEKYFPKVP